MKRTIPYLVVWTGKNSNVTESYVAWSLSNARTLAKGRKAKVYQLKIEKEVAHDQPAP